MDKYIKTFYEFNEALVMELFKESLIMGRPLTVEERQEVIIRTMDLRSKGKYKPDPDLERFIKGESCDWDYYRSLARAFKERRIERERLRNKFLKERELAESKASNPDKPKTR